MFIEHIRAVPGSWNLALQKVIRPVWYWFLDCNITRPTDVSIRRAGFSSTDIEIYGADEMVGGFPIFIRSLAKVISLTAAGSATK